MDLQNKCIQPLYPLRACYKSSNNSYIKLKKSARNVKLCPYTQPSPIWFERTIFGLIRLCQPPKGQTFNPTILAKTFDLKFSFQPDLIFPFRISLSFFPLPLCEFFPLDLSCFFNIIANYITLKLQSLTVFYGCNVRTFDTACLAVFVWQRQV